MEPARVHLWARRVLGRLWSELSFSCRWSSCSCLANLLNSELNLRGSETGTPERRWGACSNFMLLPWKPEDFYRTLQSTGCVNTCARFNIKITGHVSAGLQGSSRQTCSSVGFWSSSSWHQRTNRSPDQDNEVTWPTIKCFVFFFLIWVLISAYKQAANRLDFLLLPEKPDLLFFKWTAEEIWYKQIFKLILWLNSTIFSHKSDTVLWKSVQKSSFYLHDQLMGTRHQSESVGMIEGFRDVLTEGVAGTSGRDPPPAAVIGVRPQQVTHRALKQKQTANINLINDA